MFVFDLSDTSYHFNNPTTTTNITLCLLSIFQVSAVAATADTNNNNAIVVVSLVFFAFLFSPFDCIFLQKLLRTNNFMLLYFCYYTFFQEGVAEVSIFFYCNATTNNNKNFRVFLNCFKHKIRECGFWCTLCLGM